MSTRVMDAYESLYGTKDTMLLRGLGGNPEEVFASFEARIGEPNPLIELLGLPPTSVEDFAEGAYHEIRKRIVTLYMRKFSRAEANAIIKALCTPFSGMQTLTILDELDFNNSTFADAWSEAHPDEQRLYCYGDE